MSGKIIFVPLGGTIDPTGVRPGIGGSAYALIDEGTSSALLVDCGAYPHSHDDRERETEIALGFDEFETKTYSVVGDEVILDLPVFYNSALSGVVDVDLTELSELNMPSFEPLQHINNILVIVTHAHVDHIGSLPFFAKIFPNATICMTRATLDICMWSWNDSMKIADDQNHVLLYDAMDIARLRDEVQIISHGGKMELGPFSVSFYSSGHILGAIGVYVKPVSAASAMPRIFFTGDSSITPQRTVSAAEFPIEPVDILVTESTYGGGHNRDNRSVVEERMVSAAFACLRNGGKVLCPALTVGRSAEVYATFAKAGVFDEFPVYVDGAARRMAEIYEDHGAAPEGMIDNLLVGNSKRDRITNSREALVMIASGGMLMPSLAVHYAEEWAADDRNLFMITSWVDPCSPAAQLLKKRPGSRFTLKQGREVTLNAKVLQYGLPAHLSHDEILTIVDQLHPVRTLLVHGDERAMDALISDSHLPMEKAFLNEHYVL